MSSDVSGGDARTAAHILSQPHLPHPSPILQCCTSLRRHLPFTLNQSGLLPKSGRRRRSKRSLGDDAFPSCFHHFTAVSVHGFRNPDWAANSQRTHNSCDIRHPTALHAASGQEIYCCTSVFASQKLLCAGFVLQAVDGNMRRALTYSLALFEPPLRSERCRTIQNQARIFLGCTGCRSLFVPRRAGGAGNPLSA